MCTRKLIRYERCDHTSVQTTEYCWSSREWIPRRCKGVVDLGVYVDQDKVCAGCERALRRAVEAMMNKTGMMHAY